MDFSPQTHEAAQAYFLALLMAQYIPGYLGRQDANGAYTFFAEGDPGKQYVRIWQGERVTVAKCVNFRAPLEPNNRVWMRNVNGVLMVEYSDPLTAPVLYGDNVGAAGIPQAVLPSSNDPVVAGRLDEGRLTASTLGGLYVHSNAFTYDGGYHAGGLLDSGGSFDATYYDASVASYVPASSGYAVWVRRYFDPAAAAFHFAAGSEEFWPGVEYLDEATIADISIPAGCIPLGAVALEYGQTTVVGGRFASARFFLGKKEIEIRQIMTDGRGAPMTDGRGAFMIGSR